MYPFICKDASLFVLLAFYEHWLINHWLLGLNRDNKIRLRALKS